jgi:hypothetical protein
VFARLVMAVLWSVPDRFSGLEHVADLVVGHGCVTPSA